ncbi:MAG: hypothetical protein ABTQ32_20120 [Myxococcaceae bacterium]
MRSPVPNRPGLMTLVLIEPGVYVRVFDLDYQAEQFEVFHARWTTRWVHYLGTQLIVGAFLLLAAQASPVAAVALGAGLIAWYLAMHRVVGLVAALDVVALTAIAVSLREIVGWQHAVTVLAVAALAQNLSHAVEPVPPTLTGRGFESFPVYWRQASGWHRVRLLLLNLLYAPMELVSAPRLFAVHVLRALHRLGWRREWAMAVTARASAILAGSGR